MNKDSLISIITITYNRANIIHKCIESIQKQTYTNYEHIIVDGASTDNTEGVVKSYNDPHIKYIKLSERGPEIQMKTGTSIAQGKYITFLDDDDEYLPEKLAKQVALFETLPQEYGIVYCWMTYYDIKHPDTPIRIHKTELRGDVSEIAPSQPLISGTPTMMVRKELVDLEGGGYNDKIGIIGSDWEFMARICQHCKVDYVPESLVKVFVNHNHKRLSTDFYSDKCRKGIIFHNHFLTYFKKTFEKNPQYAKYHYWSLCRYHARLGERGKAYEYYKMLRKLNISIKDSLSLLIGIIIKR